MAMEGLFALICAGAVIAAGPASPATIKEERDTAVADALAVQTALRQAKQHLSQNDYRTAVYLLENQLARINGNQAYLNTLQDAYRGYIKELRLAKQDATAQVYLERLRILDPGAILDKSLQSAAAPVPARPSAPAPVKTTATVRAKAEEDDGDPFHSSRRDPKKDPARTLLARAEAEFSSRRYSEARLLYEQAHQTDSAATADCRDRWAYCKLHHVVEQLEHSSTPPWPELEKEVRLALNLAPKLEYGKYLLGEIEKRRSTPAGTDTPRGESGVQVRHLSRDAEGWSIVETASFRVHYTLSREQAEQAAKIAERTRADVQQKWFGGPGEDWSPKCDLFLFATAQDYAKTGVPGTSPGHSKITMENGHVVGRIVYLHCDDPNMLVAVLPHEATHVVLAGQFGEQQVPRWADEGLAVLSEPREKIERHLRNVSRCRQDGLLFTLHQLVQLSDYPDPRYIGAFYAQSVSLVEYLASERGPRVFVEFLRDGLRGGYEAALQRHYGCQGFADLEQRWTQYVANGGPTPIGVAERAR
jgi:hypothetical protein